MDLENTRSLGVDEEPLPGDLIRPVDTPFSDWRVLGGFEECPSNYEVRRPTVDRPTAANYRTSNSPDRQTKTTVPARVPTLPPDSEYVFINPEDAELGDQIQLDTRGSWHLVTQHDLNHIGCRGVSFFRRVVKSVEPASIITNVRNQHEAIVETFRIMAGMEGVSNAVTV